MYFNVKIMYICKKSTYCQIHVIQWKNVCNSITATRHSPYEKQREEYSWDKNVIHFFLRKSYKNGRWCSIFLHDWAITVTLSPRKKNNLDSTQCTFVALSSKSFSCAILHYSSGFIIYFAVAFLQTDTLNVAWHAMGRTNKYIEINT